MSYCRVCLKELNHSGGSCPRCGFQEPAFFGDPAKAQQLISRKADAYRTQYLSQFDFGVTVYYWKDKDGTLVPDRTERLSFGSGEALLGAAQWLDQPFARVPDVEAMGLQLDIRQAGTSYRTMSVQVPVPKGAHLQQAGISLSPDMKVRLLLKNPQDQTQSEPISFLRD